MHKISSIIEHFRLYLTSRIISNGMKANFLVIIKNYSLAVFLFSPAPIAYAAVSDIFDLESLVLSLLSKLAGALVILALMLFFWGLVKFIAHSADAKEREEGKKFIIWGLVSLLALFSLWSLVAILLGDFGVSVGPIEYIDSDGTPAPLLLVT